MLSIFGKSRAKSPSELVKAIKDDLEVLDKKLDAKSSQKASEEISKHLLAMKNMLYGDGENPPSPDLIVQLANEAQRNNLLELLVTNLARFEFEARKDVAQIFNNLLRRQASNGQTMVSFVLSKPVILETLVNGYENTEIALNCGSMLRECIRQEVLAKAILDSDTDLFYKFFKYVEVSTFDVASDAFATFKDLLSKHKTMVAEFLEKNFDKVIDAYTGLLNSANYVTRRQSLKLLGELLLDRANFNIMTRYISSADNLKLTMNLLRDKSKSIQFEAFHVFKVFVANPHKSAPIRDILYKNKDKLIAFLQNFQNDKEEDEQFSEEKQLLLKEISNLQPPATTAT